MSFGRFPSDSRTVEREVSLQEPAKSAPITSEWLTKVIPRREAEIASLHLILEAYIQDQGCLDFM